MGELRCEGLAKSYGTRAVIAGLDLVVAAGTLTAILGASGSGKTTLLRLIIGFIPMDEGVITVAGTVVADAGRVHVAADKRAIGYVAQEGALFPHLTVAENVAFGLPRSERKSTSRIGEVLDLVGLDRVYTSRSPPRALRRRTASRCARKGACATATGRASRRAVLRSGRLTPGRDARGGPERARQRGDDGGARHPRSGRSPVDGS